MTYKGEFSIDSFNKSFPGHPWIFRATEDGGRMMVAKTRNRVHYPEKAASRAIQTVEGPMPFQAVFITEDIGGGIYYSHSSLNFSGRPLKQICMNRISRLVSTDDIFSLGIPVNLLVRSLCYSNAGSSFQMDLIEFYINKILYTHASSNPLEKTAALKTVEFLKAKLAECSAE